MSTKSVPTYRIVVDVNANKTDILVHLIYTGMSNPNSKTIQKTRGYYREMFTLLRIEQSAKKHNRKIAIRIHDIDGKVTPIGIKTFVDPNYNRKKVSLNGVALYMK